MYIIPLTFAFVKPFIYFCQKMCKIINAQLRSLLKVCKKERNNFLFFILLSYALLTFPILCYPLLYYPYLTYPVEHKCFQKSAMEL